MENNLLRTMLQEAGLKRGKSTSSTVYKAYTRRAPGCVLFTGEFMDKLFTILEQLAEGRREVIRCKETTTKVILITAEDVGDLWCEIDDKGISLGHAGKLTDAEIYKRNRTGLGRKMNRLKGNTKYRVIKPYKYDGGPLHYHADQDEILIFTGKSLGYAHFESVKGHRTVIMKGKEAFKHLEEVETGGGKDV